MSTDDRIGVSGPPDGGQTVSFSPVRWSYQLKYWPVPSNRSMSSSVPIVRRSRDTSSERRMMPSRSAVTALHMYAPMLVVDVWTERLPSLSRMSLGRPDCSSVIAANERQVSSA